jgi:hypothetical protein
MALFVQYLTFITLFIIAQSFSMWGQYMTLPYKNISMIDAYKMAIPFAWLDWLVMAFTVNIGDKYKLVTPTQDTFLLIIIQFCLVLIINNFYLKQKLTRSDIIAFFIILLGFFVSFLHIISKTFGYTIPEGHQEPESFIPSKFNRFKYKYYNHPVFNNNNNNNNNKFKKIIKKTKNSTYHKHGGKYDILHHDNHRLY